MINIGNIAGDYVESIEIDLMTQPRYRPGEVSPGQTLVLRVPYEMLDAIQRERGITDGLSVPRAREVWDEGRLAEKLTKMRASQVYEGEELTEENLRGFMQEPVEVGFFEPFKSEIIELQVSRIPRTIED